VIRFDDPQRELHLSVRDLADAGSGPALEVVTTRATRAAAGRDVHARHVAERVQENAEYRPEVTVRKTLVVGEWTVSLWGRVDGLHHEDGHPVVEEVKSTALDARRLYATTVADYPAHRTQLAIYLWMLAERDQPEPVGRLVLVSLVDGARHVLGLGLAHEETDRAVRIRLERLCAARDRRIAWMATRRQGEVPDPHAAWRPGQREIAEAVEWGLEAGHPVLVEAPTGLGKTDAVLVGALRLARRTDRQVFWATARTTQQAGVVAAVERLRRGGLVVRSTTLVARDKLCPGTCRAAGRCERVEGHDDRAHEHSLPDRLADLAVHVDADALKEEGQRCTLCPFDLGLDLTEQVDLVIGDYNYVLDPGSFLRRHFADRPEQWIVVADEVHQLAERVREALSPRLEAALAREAQHRLWLRGAAFAPYVALAQEVESLVVQLAASAEGRSGGTQVCAPLPQEALAALAQRVDAVGLDYALLSADSPAGDSDPWVDLARSVLRMGDPPVEGAVGVAERAEGAEWIGWWCLDPSPYSGPRLAALGGFVGLSATLRPAAFHVAELGLPAERVDVVSLPSPFPPEHRRVLIAPRVSTAYKDRESHAAPTAALLAACVAAVPGNVALYFPSFAMLTDLVDRIGQTDREWIIQRPGMDDALRADALTQLADPGRRKVLCAVLGGVFAEGIDLPAGALDAVVVVGPSLPPVGLFRELLQERYAERFGDGFLYGSLVPGLTRVVQAAGRLIRRPEDRGVIVLVDRRFRWRAVLGLLPPEWTPAVADDPARAIATFFQPVGPDAPPGSG
jgi:DNA excision repair protein ERCC-2